MKKNLIRKLTLTIFLVFACFYFFTTVAHAGSITLSDVSSDQTQAEFLDAEFLFEVESAGTVLRLTVFNNTTEGTDGTYLINEIYFNATDAVTDLTASSINGWEFWHLADLNNNNEKNKTKADGFGKFDFALLGGVGQSDLQIDPGGSLEFVFNIFPTDDTVTQDDFTDIINALSTEGFRAAAKFVQGPEANDPDEVAKVSGEDSAYGAAVPEPSTLLLLGSGLIGIALLGRRRFNNN